MHDLTYPISRHNDFMKYGENLAEECPDINHSEAENRVRFYKSLDKVAGLGVQDFIMVMIPHPMRYSGGNSATHRIPRYEIIILKAIGTELAKIDETCDECLVIMDKILKRLRYDSDPVRLTERVFTYWRVEEISTELIDAPIMSDGFVGASSTIPMGTPENLIWDPENPWK